MPPLRQDAPARAARVAAAGAPSVRCCDDDIPVGHADDGGHARGVTVSWRDARAISISTGVGLGARRAVLRAVAPRAAEQHCDADRRL